MHPTVARVVEAARQAGLEIEVERFPEGTRTAADAARAVGCEVGQIVKSLVFMVNGAPVLALVSGANRLDAAKLGAAIGVTSVRRADGDEARAATGFSIGGVPPFGHARSLPVVVDRALTAHEALWAAAGLPDAVFRITPAELMRVTRGTLADLAEAPQPASPTPPA